MARILTPGEIAPEFELPTARGGRFASRDMRGKRWLLSFHRYAT